MSRLFDALQALESREIGPVESRGSVNGVFSGQDSAGFSEKKGMANPSVAFSNRRFLMVISLVVLITAVAGGAVYLYPNLFNGFYTGQVNSSNTPQNMEQEAEFAEEAVQKKAEPSSKIRKTTVSGNEGVVSRLETDNEGSSVLLEKTAGKSVQGNGWAEGLGHADLTVKGHLDGEAKIAASGKAHSKEPSRLHQVPEKGALTEFVHTREAVVQQPKAKKPVKREPARRTATKRVKANRVDTTVDPGMLEQARRARKRMKLLQAAEDLRGRGDYAGAALVYRKLWRNWKAGEIANNLAACLIMEKRYSEARKILEQALSDNPADPDLRYNLKVLNNMSK